jgi:hypothetical protein
MRHAHHQHRNPFVLDLRNHPVIADPPPPISGMLADQGATDQARVVERGYPFLKRPDDPRGDLPVQLAQFLCRFRQELNRPDQARPSVC